MLGFIKFSGSSVAQSLLASSGRQQQERPQVSRQVFKGNCPLGLPKIGITPRNVLWREEYKLIKASQAPFIQGR